MADIMGMNFNWVDFIIILIFILAFCSGMARGFAREVVSLITLVVAFVIASTYAEQLSTFFTQTSSAQTAVSSLSSTMGLDAEKPVSLLALGASFVIIFIGVSILGSLVGYFLGMAVNVVGVLNLSNRLLGGLFGLGKGFLINLITIFLLQMTPIGTQPWWASSTLVREFQPAVQWLGSYISPTLNNISTKVTATWQSINSSLNSNSQRLLP